MLLVPKKTMNNTVPENLLTYLLKIMIQIVSDWRTNIIRYMNITGQLNIKLKIKVDNNHAKGQLGIDFEKNELKGH